jgi:hypothetical protein
MSTGGLAHHFIDFDHDDIGSNQLRHGGDEVLAKNKYQFEKRMKELARKKKKEEKRQRKLDRNNFASKGITEQVRLEESDSV